MQQFTNKPKRQVVLVSEILYQVMKGHTGRNAKDLRVRGESTNE
jgi:hypothetical protein